MTVRDQLLSLQWTQLKHDEAYHKDIVVLPLAQRIKHMALHNTKYTAHLFEAVETDDQARLIKTLTDAFIISLASANTLNQDLGRELGEAAVTVTSLPALGAALTIELVRTRPTRSGSCGRLLARMAGSRRPAKLGTIWKVCRFATLIGPASSPS